LMGVTRREFLKRGAAAGMAAAAPLRAPLAAPAIHRSAVEPVVIASMNGNWFKNGGPVTGVEQAYTQMTRGGDVLDALIAGVTILELDAEEDSVGYGGLPNADGVVQLDACCMHGPRRRAGGVAGLEGVRTPAKVAQAVMDQTDHHLLVGAGAQAFARGLGFAIEPDLNTEHSRRAWLEWKRRSDPKHYLDPGRRAANDRRVLDSLFDDGLLNSRVVHGTVNCDGINAKGEIGGVTTTSGLAWKIPGRVGDSPILGAGLYVDGAVGAAGSTGRGEANLYGLSSFLIVENLRRGMHPKDAGLEALRRVRANTVERRLRRSNGEPNFSLSFYILNAKGEHAGVSMYAEDDDYRGWGENTDRGYMKYAYCDRNGPRTVQCEALLPGILKAEA
ncbi:MAG: N(4)-(beta-N-acetylglucosaminyl)-L-asparaginase, partial [Gemmatimonadales bacterium]